MKSELLLSAIGVLLLLCCGQLKGKELKFADFQWLPSRALTFTAVGATGLFYSVEASSNLSAWQPIAQVYSANGRLAITDVAAETTTRFYRGSANIPNATVVTNYHGWTNVIVLNNGLVEAVIVPSIGRVMQLRFVGETNGPFWENRNLDGQDQGTNTWIAHSGSFGGDKAWPAPQSDWNWPPPVGFDGTAGSAFITNGVVTLVTQVDPIFKIRAIREVSLAFDQPQMRIATTFERVEPSTKPTNVSVWVITQLAEPVRMFVPLPAPSIFTNGYTLLSAEGPPSLTISNHLLSLTRHPTTTYKIGSDSGTLLWVGTSHALRIDSPRQPVIPPTGYPDNGSSAEIYTHNGPPYVELEMLGPLVSLPVGRTTQSTVTYQLFRRTQTTAEQEAAVILRK